MARRGRFSFRPGSTRFSFPFESDGLSRFYSGLKGRTMRNEPPTPNQGSFFSRAVHRPCAAPNTTRRAHQDGPDVTVFG